MFCSHPETSLFVLSEVLLNGTKCPKKCWFDFENRITGCRCTVLAQAAVVAALRFVRMISWSACVHEMLNYRRKFGPLTAQCAAHTRFMMTHDS